MVLPLSAPPLSLSHTAIGLFGLAGVAGALAARRAGRWADQGLGQRVTGIALGLLTLSWLPISVAETSLVALVCGAVLLDFAVQAVHHQPEHHFRRTTRRPKPHGRRLHVLLLGRQRAGAAATQVYAFWGWEAVSLLGALISVSAWILWFLTSQLTAVDNPPPLP